MQITVRGKTKGISKINVHRACTHYAHKLLSKRLSDNITCEIVFLTDAQFSKKHPEFTTKDIATCLPTHQDGAGRPPRIFEIDLRADIEPKLCLTTIAHEFVHLRQYAKGELVDEHRGQEAVHRWKGEIINELVYDKEHDDMGYWFVPWELEAMSLEQGLVRTWLKKHKRDRLIREKARKRHQKIPPEHM